MAAQLITRNGCWLRRLWLTREEWRRSVGPIFRGGIIGFIVGVLPGAGGTIASILSYTTEKRLSKHPEEFGKGAVEGVAGPESANNSDTAGAMVPLLTLGVPGGGATAVLLGAFIMYGIQPGRLHRFRKKRATAIQASSPALHRADPPHGVRLRASTR